MHIKKQRFTLTLALLALAGWALSVRGLSAAAGETDRNQPSTRAAAPATQPRPVEMESINTIMKADEARNLQFRPGRHAPSLNRSPNPALAHPSATTGSSDAGFFFVAG